MSSTRNPTVLHGIQFIITTQFYTHSLLVFNNSCTASQTTLALRTNHSRQDTSISFWHCTALCFRAEVSKQRISLGDLPCDPSRSQRIFQSNTSNTFRSFSLTAHQTSLLKNVPFKNHAWQRQ